MTPIQVAVVFVTILIVAGCGAYYVDEQRKVYKRTPLEEFRQAIIARGRPQFGKPGTRDVDVAADIALYDIAVGLPEPKATPKMPIPQSVPWTPNRRMPPTPMPDWARRHTSMRHHKSRVRWLVKPAYRVPELQTRWGNTHTRMRRLQAR